MLEPLSCSIIIRCYNEEEHIGRLLTGIMQQSLNDVEIIIVDSGSTDATVAIASRYPIKLVEINKAEFTFGRSLNQGCQAATKDYLVIASAHVYPVYTDWLEQLLRPFTNPSVGLVYGKQRGNAVTKYSETRIFEKWFPDETNPHQDTPFCNNANAAIPRVLWEEYPYDESLTGLEDIAWARKILDLGYHLSYVAAAEIIHVHDEHYTQVYNRYRREAIAFKTIFPEAEFTLLQFLRLLVSNVLSDQFHATLDGIWHRHWLHIIRFRVAQLWGTYRGYAWHQPITTQVYRRFYYPKVKRKKDNAADNRRNLRIQYQSATMKYNPRTDCNESD
jgi:rhamnosyltransferase